MKKFISAAMLTALMLSSDLYGQHPGQAPRSPRRVPVTVAILDTLTASPFRIARRNEGPVLDMILLRPDADSTVLSAAVRELLLIRGAQGDTARAPGMVRVRPRSTPRAASGPVLPWARRVVRDVQIATPKQVAGIGVVRSVQVWLPPQRGRSPVR